MNKLLIEKGIVHYTFPPYLPRCHFNDSITVLVDGGRALFIDAGYESEAEQALQDLEAQGLELKGVIVSHFHDDHMQGLKVLPRVPVYGSARYQETLNMWNEKAEHPFFAPSVKVGAPYSFHFGRHRLEIIPFPGHSICTVLTCIDGKYLHIADELMFGDEGLPLLPIPDAHAFARQAGALEALREYADLVFIPAHGPVFSGRERILREIDCRIAYLSAVTHSDRELAYAEAAKDCGCSFQHSEWHRFNYE